MDAEKITGAWAFLDDDERQVLMNASSLHGNLVENFGFTPDEFMALLDHAEQARVAV